MSKFQKLLKCSQNLLKDFKINPNEVGFQESYRQVCKEVVGLTAKDFNLHQNPFKNLNGYTNYDVYEDQNKEVCFGLFLLPKGMIIPLHDHPGMWVVTKILKGKAIRTTMEIEPQDRHIQWTYPNRIHIQKDEKLKNSVVKVKAKLLGINQVEQDMIDFVKPVYNNLHQFEAVEDFIFFNCFVPHYDDKTRFSNFYQVLDPLNENTKSVNLRILSKATDFYNYKKEIKKFEDMDCEFYQENNNKREQISENEGLEVIPSIDYSKIQAEI